ncbi:MAG: hypothetical protein IJY63_01360 [Clostridia bacterium]|nr:hypothetical protein [Clostridia bacterium]
MWKNQKKMAVFKKKHFEIAAPTPRRHYERSLVSSWRWLAMTETIA